MSIIKKWNLESNRIFLRFRKYKVPFISKGRADMTVNNVLLKRPNEQIYSPFHEESLIIFMGKPAQ